MHFLQQIAQMPVHLCPLRSSQGLLLEDVALRTDTLPSATWQEIDLRLAQQLLLRDHSALGTTALFALTVSGDLTSPEAPAHTQSHSSAQRRLRFQGKACVYHQCDHATGRLRLAWLCYSLVNGCHKLFSVWSTSPRAIR